VRGRQPRRCLPDERGDKDILLGSLQSGEQAGEAVRAVGHNALRLEHHLLGLAALSHEGLDLAPQLGDLSARTLQPVIEDGR